MRIALAIATISLGLLGACSESNDDQAASASAAATTSVTEVTTTTVAPTTTVEATTTTAAPTGSVQACEGFLTLDDPDSDSWGECIATLEDAQEQYFVISGKINGATANLNVNRAADCAAYLAANRLFIDDLKAGTWPAEVQPALDELVASTEYELFVLEDDCTVSTQALVDEVTQRRTNAIFNFRTAIGSPTDF